MKKSIAIICGAALLASAFTARAQNTTGYISEPKDVSVITPSTTKGPLFDQSIQEVSARKLVRGLDNVAFCLAEIPVTMFEEAYRTSPVTGSVVGAVKGVAKAGKRLVIGLWEVATFYAPTKNNYQPYVNPEVVTQDYLH